MSLKKKTQISTAPLVDLNPSSSLKKEDDSTDLCPALSLNFWFYLPLKRPRTAAQRALRFTHSTLALLSECHSI